MDSVTQKNIATLHPTLRAKATAIVNEVNGVLTGRSQIRVCQAFRTNAQQDADYAKRPKITNAKGGQSPHNYGGAVDIVMMIDGKEASWDTHADWDKDTISDWMEAVAIFKKYGWKWGGDWKNPDKPHFEAPGFSDWRMLSKLPKGPDGYVIL